MINEQSLKSKHSSCWKRRTRLEKWLLLILSILIVLITIILSLKLVRNSPASSDVKLQMCLTTGCQKAAITVLERIDFSIDPCQDFYKFACGNFVKNTIVPEYTTSVSSFSIVSDVVDEQMRTLLEQPIKETDARPVSIVKSIYQSCMNISEIEANSLNNLKNIFKKIGGWPVVEGQKWKENLFSWTKTSYSFMELGFNYDIFFEFGIDYDVTNSTRLILQLDQPFIVSFDRMMRRGFTEPIVQAYYDYMVKVAIAFGANPTIALKEMRDVVNLDITISRITVPSEDRRNSSIENNPMTIRELRRRFSYVPWLEYINKMLYPVKEMTYEDTVVVTLPQYFEDLKNVLASIQKRTLANYMYWKTVRDLIKYLNNKIRSLQLDFSKVASGTTKRNSRWKECIKTAGRITIASSSLYVRHFFQKSAKNTMLEMVNNIKAQLIENLKSLDWMDDDTRKHALKKASIIEANIGYPEELNNEMKLDLYYQNLTVNAFKYLESVQNVTLFTRRQNFAKLDEIVHKKDWINHANAVVINAFYNPSENSIELPASLLQGIFFDNARPQYMNYGAIGIIIGHELIHGFDDEGRQFDEKGNLVDWWLPKTKQAFEDKIQCIIEQYSNLTVPEINLNLNGINTQGENIADNGGIKEAYFAYKKWVKDHQVELGLPGLPYTPEQMFWISAGNTWCGVERKEQLKINVMNEVHAPNYYRVNVPLMNSDDFAKDFQCPLGSQMNPSKKCLIW